MELYFIEKKQKPDSIIVRESKRVRVSKKREVKTVRFNLKNRPRPYSTRKNPTKSEVAWFRWCQGFEAELREMERQPGKFRTPLLECGEIYIPIKEILGE